MTPCKKCGANSWVHSYTHIREGREIKLRMHCPTCGNWSVAYSEDGLAWSVQRRNSGRPGKELKIINVEATSAPC
mgnify:FL=1